MKKSGFKFFVCCLLFTVYSLPSFSQSAEYSTTNKKAIKHYEEAIRYFDMRDNENSIKEVKKALEKDPAFMEAYLLLAGVYIDTREYPKAIEQYEKSFSVNPGFFPNSYYTVGNLCIYTGQYEKAKKYLQTFLNYPGIDESFRKNALKGIENCEFAIVAIKHPVPFIPSNMGESINSPDDEYFPSITADAKLFMLTRNLKDNTSRVGYQEDFFVSQFIDTAWSKAFNIGAPINTPDNEGAPSISADGQIIVFAACNRDEGKGSCDLYYTRRIGNKWVRPVNVGPPINTRNWETQPCLSSDGKTLYFIRGTVTREGIKNQDIYYSELSKEGYWGNPVALGSRINTPESEVSVFIHPDNQTLYFSSDGHPGMGRLDIFMSRREPDGQWGTPVNLGYPINTYNDENSLLVSPNGELAYFASNREGGKGGLDLYQFDLYKEVRPEKITYVKGKVFDSRSRKPLSATFELIDLATAETVIESESNMGNGEFLVCLTANHNYALNVSKNGYLFYSENFSLKDAADISKPIQMDIPLQPIDTGMIVELKNIFFETGKYDLKEESKAELLKLISFLNTNASLKVEISGHTDNVGDKKSNLLLSQNRAKTVYDYLINNTIPSDRLSYKGYGDTKPKVSNSTPENRAKNRRTEFKVTGK